MCGICGYVSFGPSPLGAGAAARVEAMLGALAHRGPDDAGLHASATAVLGATRLAIRGIADGRQPLVDQESGVVAVCNGEIDNHRELKAWLAARGRPVNQATDVAIIPGLYLELGDAFPEWLVGAFAIGVWDPGRRRLLLVRDRAGEKPLCFFAPARYPRRVPQPLQPAEAGEPPQLGEALFATELAALAPSLEASERTAAAPALDVEALAHYLRFGCFAVPRTPFAGIQKVGPGERVVVDASGVHRERYWRWRTTSRPTAEGLDLGCGSSSGSGPGSGPGQARPRQPAAVGSSARLAEMDRLFRQAVARQTDVEVHCGVFLSGGVDSSLITAVARAVRPELPLRAFSLRFPETSYDEGEIAAGVARLLGLATTEVWVHPEDFMTCLPELVRMAGEPLADPAWVPAALLARRAAAEVGQVLVGEGGDELFGGYPTYSGVWLGERYERLPRALRRPLAGLVRRLPPSDKKVTLSYLLKRFVDGEGLEGLARHLLWTSNIAPETLARLGLRGAPPAQPALPAGSLLDHVQQHDLETSLAEGLLTKADRASMHYALELRAPFLDREVMEFAATLPERERVRGFKTKIFLKRYASRYLPRWVVHRRKRGLSVPLASWLRGPLRGWAAERLASGRLGTAGIDEGVASALFGEHLRRERDHGRALWTLVVLAEWLDWAAGVRGLDGLSNPGGLAQPEAVDAVAAPAANATLGSDVCDDDAMSAAAATAALGVAARRV